MPCLDQRRAVNAFGNSLSDKQINLNLYSTLNELNWVVGLKLTMRLNDLFICHHMVPQNQNVTVGFSFTSPLLNLGTYQTPYSPFLVA